MLIFRRWCGPFGTPCAIDTAMQADLRETITALDDWETIICCRGLVVLMDDHMARDPQSGRPPETTVTDFHQWVGLGGRPVRALLGALCKGNPALTATVGRRLMLTCLAWKCRDEMGAACRLIYGPVDDIGTLAPETVVGALAAVMLWHPARPTLQTLLQPAAVRRFPWLRHQEPAAASAKAPAATVHRAKAVSAGTMPE